MNDNPTLSHALCQTDMELVRALLQQNKPNMESLTVVGRLFSRYTGVAGDSPAAEILEGLNECLYKWDMTRSELCWCSGSQTLRYDDRTSLVETKKGEEYLDIK